MAATTEGSGGRAVGQRRASGDALRRTEMRKSGRTALSIEKFIKARRSTYDKRERIKQNRAEGAARKAQYERLQKKLGSKIERAEEFDPELYQKRLAAIDDPRVGSVAGPSGQGDEQGEGDARALADGAKDDDAPDEQLTVSERGKKGKFDRVKHMMEQKKAAREAREAERKEFLAAKAKRDQELRDQRDRRENKKNLMRKKNKRGQPVMKHRVQSILDKLASEMR